jgi:molybdopterin converting factor small subunit
MASLTVRYHNVLRSAAGLAEETWPLPENATLYALLQALAGGHGSPLRELLLEADGSVVSHLVVFRNRKLVSGDPHSVSLADGDEVLLFPAVSGG